MIRKIKSNKIIIFIVLLICFIFASSPLTYSKSCLNGLSVWATKIFPVMFPFFVFCRIIVSLTENKSNVMDKFFNKCYNTPNRTAQTYFLSILSGYPMGAKLICDLYENKQITSTDAKKMMSICSVSGPMFILGTVGVAVFGSYSAGIVILISNVVASLLNGFIYRGKKCKLIEITPTKQTHQNIVSDAVSNSLMSILLVGAYIVLSFLIIDIVLSFDWFWNGILMIFKLFNIADKFEIFKASFCGLMEITCGIINLNNCPISLTVKTIISSGLIGMGGLCIFMQNTHFLTKLGIKKRTILLQKLTQGLLCIIVSIPLAIIIL